MWVRYVSLLQRKNTEANEDLTRMRMREEDPEGTFEKNGGKVS